MPPTTPGQTALNVRLTLTLNASGVWRVPVRVRDIADFVGPDLIGASYRLS
jgi:hypothetical protein